MFVNGKEVFKFKAGNKNFEFLTRFFLGSISNGFSATESREVPLNGNVYDFSVDCNSIDKSEILDSHKCLLTKKKKVMFSMFVLLLGFSSIFNLSYILG